MEERERISTVKIQKVLDIEDRWKTRGYRVQGFHGTKNSPRLHSTLGESQGQIPNLFTFLTTCFQNLHQGHPCLIQASYKK